MQDVDSPQLRQSAARRRVLPMGVDLARLSDIAVNQNEEKQ